jgi:hypothetical protein
MIATRENLNLLDGASCEFMGEGMVVVRQQDDTKMRVSAIPLAANVFQTAERLEASEDAPLRRAGIAVENVRIHLMGDETILFSYFDEENRTTEDVVLTLGDIQRVLAALSDGTAH